jgi:ribosomal 50S subunit-recycling heat shock protein
MTEREFHFLLTFLPGYEACQLGWGTGSPQGFALFRCNADAVAAVDRLAGHQVEVGSVLRAELAHKNLVIKVCGAPAGACRADNNHNCYVNTSQMHWKQRQAAAAVAEACKAGQK